jgi:uncharacterized repeat protein (TIGR01451 family)
MLGVSITSSPSISFPGELLNYTIVIQNDHATLPATHLVLTDTLPAGTIFVSSTHLYLLDGDTIRWEIPSLAAQQTIDIQLVVRVDRTAFDLITNDDYGVYSDQAAFVRGLPVTTLIGRLFFLPFASKSP